MNSVRYRGYVYDQETGLYYLQSRYYDPETGRFLNADDVDYIPVLLIVKGVANLYSYCWNNPISYEDATGCLTWPGEIHNVVIDRILKRHSGLESNKKIYYGNGKYGYCDIVHLKKRKCGK